MTSLREFIAEAARAAEEARAAEAAKADAEKTKEEVEAEFR